MNNAELGRGLRIVFALIAASAAGACSSAAPLGGGQAGAGGGGGAAGAAGGSSGPMSDAAMDVVATPPPDADPSLPPDMTAPLAPDVACTGEADAGIECDLPPSTCAMPAACDGGAGTCASYASWIVYYENGRCVAGHCVWDQRYFQCANTSVCNQGACASILLTT